MPVSVCTWKFFIKSTLIFEKSIPTNIIPAKQNTFTVLQKTFRTHAGDPVGDPVDEVPGSSQNANHHEVDKEPDRVQPAFIVTRHILPRLMMALFRQLPL